VIARKSTTLGSEKETDVVRARQIIRDRACEGVSIEEILDALSVSRSTLTREFASVLGCTPGEEMTRVRLERSKELLGTTTLPIARIAQMVGYASATNFTTFFRRHTGKTPRAFRKQ
jgi:LacI family transcriptional regulator